MEPSDEQGAPEKAPVLGTGCQAPSGTPASRWSRLAAWIEPINFIIGMAFGMLAVGFAGAWWVKQQAKEAVLEPEFLSELGKKVRPSVIIDAHGSVLVDQGAMELLERIEIDNSGHRDLAVWTNAYPWRIVVKPKRPLSHAPILTPLDPVYLGDPFVRVPNGWDWSMTFSNSFPLNFGNRDQEAAKGGPPFRYRLEILY